MPASDISLDTDPDEVSREAGATAQSGPPPTITGILADYANRPLPQVNSLGMVMDDPQMRDAGVHPDQLNGAPDTSVIDATGAGDPKADPAAGYIKAMETTRKAVTGTHTGVSGLAAAAAGAKALADGGTLRSAWGAAKGVWDDPVVKGIRGLNKVYAPLLYGAEGFARGADDLQNGASVPDTIVGNAMRTGVVVGAGMIPVAGPFVAGVADRYLPDGAAMGHAYFKSYADTDGRSLLLP